MAVLTLISAFGVSACGPTNNDQSNPANKSTGSPPHAPTSAQPPANPFLAAPTYGITHIDSAQSDTFPYPAPRGTFHIDPTKQQRVPSGPITIMTLASTSPDYMWVSSSSGARYVNIADGAFKEIAGLAPPGVKTVPTQALDPLLDRQFTAVTQIKDAINDQWRIDFSSVVSNGVYSLVDKDNRLYYTTSNADVVVFALNNPANPAAGIKIDKTFSFKPLLDPHRGLGGTPESIVGLAMTYDGHLAVLTSNGITVMNRDLTGTPQQLRFGPDEVVSNSMTIDPHGGIYAASDKVLRKVVWNGTKLSDNPADGAWASPYDFGRQPPSVKIGIGTGSTPTLMGGDNDDDKLVVITDGADRMKLVAFWSDDIPRGFRQKPGTKSNRIADQIQVTAGLDPSPEFIQSEQSVVINGYGAFVVNNIRSQGTPDRLIDVLAGGPVLEPPHGVQRFTWDTASDSWRSVWERGDVISTSMVPTASTQTNTVLVNGYTKTDGWEVTGLDWDTGQTVHRTIFGQSNYGNGAYALIEFFPDGDLLFNSIGGPFRARLTK